jgi:hypothetical protein
MLPWPYAHCDTVYMRFATVTPANIMHKAPRHIVNLSAHEPFRNNLDAKPCVTWSTHAHSRTCTIAQPTSCTAAQGSAAAMSTVSKRWHWPFPNSQSTPNPQTLLPLTQCCQSERQQCCTVLWLCTQAANIAAIRMAAMLHCVVAQPPPHVQCWFAQTYSRNTKECWTHPVPFGP